MEFELLYTGEQEAFRAEVSSWLDANIPAGMTDIPTSAEHSERLYRTRRAFGLKLGERGWLYPAGDKRYGGGGLSFDQIIVLEEEASKRNVNLPPYYDSGGWLGGASIQVWGTEEQKAAFLPPIYTGKVRSWQLLSEPTAGSDLAGVRTSAVRAGDEYVLNGTKVFIGSGHGADWLWTLAVTDPEGERHKNLSWFIFPADLPGVTIQPQRMWSNKGEGGVYDDFSHKNTIFLEQVRVPASCLIGGENNGWKVAGTHLEIEHGSNGNIRSNPIWGKLLAYCRSHHRDGYPLIEDPDVRLALVRIYTRLESARLLAQRNFWMSYTGHEMSYEGSQADYVRKTTGLWLTGAIHDLFGPEAITKDGLHGALGGIAEYQHRAGIQETHPGGTTDILRVVMARRLGIGKRAKETAGARAPISAGVGTAGAHATPGQGMGG